MAPEPFIQPLQHSWSIYCMQQEAGGAEVNSTAIPALVELTF